MLTLKGKCNRKICCFHQPADVFLQSFRCEHFFELIFRLQLDANDASYCIYGPIHLCLFPSLAPPFTHPLASVISFCNESSSAHQWLKMILEILIRAPFLTKLHSIRLQIKLEITKVCGNKANGIG